MSDRPILDDSLEGDDDDLRLIVDADDLDELVREVDRRADDRRWAELGRLIVRARRAHERGRTLWPAATYASHRMALDAPAPWAVAALVDGTSSLGLGPLSEVIACRHTWAELDGLLDESPVRYVVAHERGLRGDPDVAGLDVGGPADPFGHSPVPADWEDRHVPAEYTTSGLTVHRPMREGPAESFPAVGALRSEPDTDEGAEALRHLLDVRADQRPVVLAGAGDPSAAVGSLRATLRNGDAETPRRNGDVRAQSCSPGAAVADLAWVAAGGGAATRRRGLARGRFDALWTAAALLGATDEWPLDATQLGEDLAELRWWCCESASASDETVGWIVHDPVDRLVWLGLSGSSAPR